MCPRYKPNKITPPIKIENLILGGGLAGLSSSYHIGHEQCLILEAKPSAFGHIASHQQDGYTWDEGPHVSFTENAYVKDLFEKSVGGELLDYPVAVDNWFRVHWIDHQAQSNLYQAPSETREKVLAGFLESRIEGNLNSTPPANYAEWHNQTFGQAFTDTFPWSYTRKYWTVEPEKLGVDWMNFYNHERMHQHLYTTTPGSSYDSSQSQEFTGYGKEFT